MTTDFSARLRRHGLSAPAAERAANQFARAEAAFVEGFGGPPATAWWIPGRIEVLGKHTDYGGGRSLLCTVERGFHLLARPIRDGLVRLLDARSGTRLELALDPDAPLQPGRWADYPTTVVRRIARDFPDARTGMDAAFISNLPPASGLSSSSALVIATFLPLAEVNDLAATAPWRRSLPIAAPWPAISAPWKMARPSTPSRQIAASALMAAARITPPFSVAAVVTCHSFTSCRSRPNMRPRCPAGGNS